MGGDGVWMRWADAQLDAVRAADRWRAVHTFDAKGPAGSLAGSPAISFTSNDYLGLATHPGVIAAAHAAIDMWGTGASASRILGGSRPCHDELEAELADWKHVERAVLLSSGFAANLAVLTVFGGPDVTVFSDELNHASIIDGCRLGRSTVRVHRHRDVAQLDDLLAATPGRKLVVTDSVFSMDGDVAPVDELGRCCARRGALLVLDEAHAVLGPDVATIDGLELLRVGTMSKALGALGGWVGGPAPFVDLIVNRARTFIFSTALSPADAAAALAAVQISRGEEGVALRSRLRAHIDLVRPGHPSPIVPIVLGAEAAALEAAASLAARGLYVPAVRPPTVPVGSSRLRVTLSAGHTREMVEQLVAALDELGIER